MTAAAIGSGRGPDRYQDGDGSNGDEAARHHRRDRGTDPLRQSANAGHRVLGRVTDGVGEVSGDAARDAGDDQCDPSGAARPACTAATTTGTSPNATAYGKRARDRALQSEVVGPREADRREMQQSRRAIPSSERQWDVGDECDRRAGTRRSTADVTEGDRLVATSRRGVERRIDRVVRPAHRELTAEHGGGEQPSLRREVRRRGPSP